jgi:hypothetical protein
LIQIKQKKNSASRGGRQILQTAPILDRNHAAVGKANDAIGLQARKLTTYRFDSQPENIAHLLPV